MMEYFLGMYSQRNLKITKYGSDELSMNQKASILDLTNHTLYNSEIEFLFL